MVKSRRKIVWNFYPRPPRGGRLLPLHQRDVGAVISIHALREEGDRSGSLYLTASRISIHALREEGDRSSWSTANSLVYFYPRPPRGGRLVCAVADLQGFVISIHALREEGDQSVGYQLYNRGQFLSTPSARRATEETDATALAKKAISIHALREEGDPQTPQRAPRRARNFYPRPPRGGRLLGDLIKVCSLGISIHALREEGDMTIKAAKLVIDDFYPRPPRGGRPAPR